MVLGAIVTATDGRSWAVPCAGRSHGISSTGEDMKVLTLSLCAEVGLTEDVLPVRVISWSGDGAVVVGGADNTPSTTGALELVCLHIDLPTDLCRYDQQHLAHLAGTRAISEHKWVLAGSFSKKPIVV